MENKHLRQQQMFSLLAISFVALAAAQLPSPPGPGELPTPSAPTPTCLSGSAGTLRVLGRGRTEVTNDVAQVSLSISNLNETANGARMVAADTASAVIAALNQIAGIQPDNVTTSAISVQPQYSNANMSDEDRTVIGYTFINSLLVLIGDASNDLLSEVLDTAVMTGGDAVTVNSVTFFLSPELEAQVVGEAEEMGSADARQQAERYARYFGASLGPLLTVEVSPPYVPTPASPVYAEASSSSITRSSTPVNIGKQQINLSVTTIYTICSPRT